MTDLFLLSEGQMARIAPHFPQAHGVPRVYDRRVVSGIVCVIKHGLRWKDAPKGYGPHKMLYNRFIRWSRMGVFDLIFAGLAGEGPKAGADHDRRRPPEGSPDSGEPSKKRGGAIETRQDQPPSKLKAHPHASEDTN